MLHLDDTIRSLSFCSQRGDLLLGIGSNLNFIHHKQCLYQLFFLFLFFFIPLICILMNAFYNYTFDIRLVGSPKADLEAQLM